MIRYQLSSVCGNEDRNIFSKEEKNKVINYTQYLIIILIFQKFFFYH